MGAVSRVSLMPYCTGTIHSKTFTFDILTDGQGISPKSDNGTDMLSERDGDKGMNGSKDQSSF